MTKNITTATVAPTSEDSFAGLYAKSRESNQRPMSLVPTVPDGRYELSNASGKPIFYEVRTGKRQWIGYQNVAILQGVPGRWRRLPIKQEGLRRQILESIASQPKDAAIRFSKRFKVCAACGSDLVDPESLARGLGEGCIKKFDEQNALVTA